MACFIFVVFLSLLCLFHDHEYHPNQWASLSMINESLTSEVTQGESPEIG